MSARCSSNAASSPCVGARATPALAATACVRPSISMGCASMACNSLTHSRADGASRMSGITNANSSPPRRATVTLLGESTEEAVGDLTQDAVTDGMAESVVDLLETVEVEEDDGHARASCERVCCEREEEDTVGESCEHVVGRLVRLALDLVAQFLDETGPLEVGTGVCDQRLEQSEVVLVEFVGIPRRGRAPRLLRWLSSGSRLAPRSPRCSRRRRDRGWC